MTGKLFGSGDDLFDDVLNWFVANGRAGGLGVPAGVRDTLGGVRSQNLIQGGCCWRQPPASAGG